MEVCVPTSSLKLLDLQLQVISDARKRNRPSFRKIRISFEIHSKTLLKACFTDQLEDTHCYGTLADQISKFCSASRFQTVEKLAMGCFEILKAELPESTPFKLKLHKLHPPVKSLLGGVVFEIES
jgi:FolB domain-containing protein